MIKIPASVSGYEVTNRGAHFQPHGHHSFWCGNKERRTTVINMMRSMSMSWAVLLTDGDSALQVYDGKEVVTWLLEAGIIPIIRWWAQLPQHFTGMEVVERLYTIYQRHGLQPFFQLWNELGDPREWKNGYVPHNWWEIAVDRWNSAADIVLSLGGWPGFPDGPGYDFIRCHPFRDTNPEVWDNGAWYAVHNYVKGRPLNHPYDEVSRYGVPLTMAEYEEALDDFADNPYWNYKTVPLELINYQRALWADEEITIHSPGADACWLAWELVEYHAIDILGRKVPMATTEGGTQPKDNAGSGNQIDVRWPYRTPKGVARITTEMFDYPAPMFAQCPWLLADTEMGGSGWPFDAWWGWAFSDLYGMKKPVIQALIDHPPKASPIALLESASDNVLQAIKLLS